jgi:ABC-type Zn uptake system ZnuABC Zn-binding protein ZnuA
MEAKGTQSNFRFKLNGIQGGLNPEAIKNYMAEIQKQFNLTEDAWRELTNSIDITDFSTAKKSFQVLIEKLKETGASATEIEKITTEVERSQGTIDNFANAIGQQSNLRNFINNITQGISAVGQLAMSINTIKNLGSI